jgi:glycosyltransferase involved in cell wall biosynthesis
MQSEESDKRHLVCTVITPNYLSRFLILGESIAATCPTADLRVLVLQDCGDITKIQDAIDDYLTRLGSSADHRPVTIDQCEWGDFDVEAAALFYNILEFATSVKPALMRHFLDQGWDRVTYLDPDIQVFNDFTPLLDDASDLSLTPHFLTDIPRDGKRPTTHDVLMAGFFNLGFCSARPSASSFLEWWSDRLQFECLNDHLRGHFTDQKIVDMASLRAKVQIVTDPGCNVAYWNLHERRVVDSDGAWSIDVGGNVSPLHFFHFSGFRLDHSASLSRHSSRKVVGSAVPRAFAKEYERRVGRDGVSPYPFTLGGAKLNEPIPEEWNRCLREDADVHVRAGYSLRQVREDIYEPLDAAALEGCLSCGVAHDNFGTRVRIFLFGWACHPGLNGAPNGVGAFCRSSRFEFAQSAHEQLAWAAGQLADRVRGASGLAAAVLESARDAVRAAADLTLIGYFSYPAGTGQIARATLRTLEMADIVPAIDRVDAPGDDSNYLSYFLRRHNPVASSNSSVLGVVNADQWNNHVRDPRRINVVTQHVEAVWAWELDEIPAELFDVASSGGIERVHALSTWSARAMAQVLPVPVQRFAPFDIVSLDTLRSESDATSRSDPRYVLCTLDAKSSVARKNPEAVLRLWQRIEADFPDHWLVLKSTDLRDLASADLLDIVDGSARTRLIDDVLSDRQYVDLLTHCDVFVSLHRSEGMGLTPIEAGLCGLPVVYTNYGGVTDFMDNRFFPVAYSLVRVGESSPADGPYDVDALWAEPDLDDAERQLRRALATALDDDSVTTLLVDRKQLAENLLTAQAEVVATAQRLLSRASLEVTPRDHELEVRLRDAATPLVDELSPSPNRFLYVVVASLWRVYRLLPRSLRRQFNLTIIALHQKDRRS